MIDLEGKTVFEVLAIYEQEIELLERVLRFQQENTAHYKKMCGFYRMADEHRFRLHRYDLITYLKMIGANTSTGLIAFSEALIDWFDQRCDS